MKNNKDKPKRKQHPNQLKNLIPITSRSPEEAKRMSIKGGISRGKQIHAQKTFQELGSQLLNLKPDAQAIKIVKIMFPKIKEKEITAKMAIIARQYERALKKGDINSAIFLRDTIGEKPIEKIQNTNINTDIKFNQNITREIANKLRNDLKSDNG